MGPRDWFLVGARLFGLYVIYRGSEYFLFFLLNTAWSTSDALAAQYEQKSGLLMAAWYFALGFALLLGAESITRRVFNEQSPEPRSDDDAATESESE